MAKNSDFSILSLKYRPRSLKSSTGPRTSDNRKQTRLIMFLRNALFLHQNANSTILERYTASAFFLRNFLEILEESCISTKFTEKVKVA